MLRPIKIAMILLFLAGCGDGNTTAPDGGMTITPDAGVDTCGTGSVHEQLLNATTTAETIQKTPTHPPVTNGLP